MALLWNPSRRVVSCCLAIAALLAVAAPAARAADPGTLPPQGVYEQCTPTTSGDQACLDRLAQIRNAGFTLVLNYGLWYRTPAQLATYIATADSLGMKVIVPLNYAGWRDGSTSLKLAYKALAKTCGCTDNPGFIDYAINLVKAQPGIWGYYIGDELDPGVRYQVRALGDHVKAMDPSRPHLYIAFANKTQGTGNLAPFASDADVVGIDYYPIGTPDDVAGLGPLAAGTQALADGAGKQSAVVLQAFSWDEYPHSAAIVPRWPTLSEMQQMRDQALAKSRPSMILWYNFNDVMRSDDPAGHLADLTQAAFAPIATPDTSIVSGPDGSARSGSATFVQATTLGTHFECQLDGGAWAGCSGQQSYGGLQPGAHRFAVRAVDAVGRTDPTPATRSWTVVGSDSGSSGSGSTTATVVLRGVKATSGGSAHVTVDVSAPGKVKAQGTMRVRTSRHAKRKKHVGRATKTARHAGRVKLTIRLPKAAKRALRRDGRLKIAVRVAFTPAPGGRPAVRKKSATLRFRTATAARHTSRR